MSTSTSTDQANAPARPMMLSDYLRKHELGLNLLRLVLALLVIFSHAFPLGGWGPDPLWPTGTPATSYGGFAVGGFFALSGMLVTMSGMRSSVERFLKSRFLRLVPAYFVVIVLTAAVLAPIIYVLSNHTFAGYFSFSTQGPVMYVIKNLQFPFTLQFGIDNIFLTTTPYGRETGLSVINGSLWTIPIEIRCYLIALLVVLLGKIFGVTRAALVALAGIAFLIVVGHVRPETAVVVAPEWLPYSHQAYELVFVFLCGAAFGSVARRLPMNKVVAITAVAAFAITSVLGGAWFRTIGLGSLAIVLPLVAALLPSSRLGVFRNDLSYGTYLWAFPIQQTLAFLGIAAIHWLFLGGSVVLTLVLAGLSWKLIEQPSLRLKKKRLRVGRPRTAPL